MTFTYDPTLADSISLIRIYIGDTIENAGPRVGSKNFSDEEITAISAGVGDVVNACIAELFSVLAADWIKYAISFTIGPRKEELYRIAEQYRTSATWWSTKANPDKPFSSGLIRRDSANSRSVT